jgi:hypothetical protein
VSLRTLEYHSEFPTLEFGNTGVIPENKLLRTHIPPQKLEASKKEKLEADNFTAL